MASSRKDKFKKAIRDRMEPEKPGMQGFVADMSRARRAEPDAPVPVGPVEVASVEGLPVRAREPEPEVVAVAPPAAPIAPEQRDLGPDPLTQPAPGVDRETVPEMSAGRSENLISGTDSPTENVPRRAEFASYFRKPTMARTRDSVYNVSSDIRLEDYTESASEGGGIGGMIRIGAGVGLLLILLYVLYAVGSLFFAPDYILAVSSTQITAANAEEYADTERVSTAAGSSVYIHFQWEEGELETDYVKIQIDRVGPGGEEVEEAILARRPPITANYIQFAGPLEVGKYHITVTDRGGDTLADREVTVN